MELFRGVDLNDSFVLGWVQKADVLQFELEASIWPESDYYSRPERDEYTCYRKATLLFKDFQNIIGLKSIDSTPSTIDPDGTRDYGNIDALSQTKGGFHVSGDFGSVNIAGGELYFEIHK